MAALVVAAGPGAQGGIAGLQSWFRRKFPSSFTVAADRRVYEHVLIDMNQLIHHAVRKSNNEEHAKILVFMELNRQLERCVPTRSVVLAFDGPGPRAKLLTQRRRRAKRRAPAGKLSPFHITPGSAFMTGMYDACIYYACRRIQSQEGFDGVTFWLSGSTEPGEGEVKLIDWLNTHLPEPAPGAADTRSVCVIGSDVDLVLQCVSALPRLMSGVLGGGGHGAHGFRFEVLTKSTAAVQGRERMGPYVRISVLELARQLEASFPACTAAQVSHDLIALMTMFGNDYLPRLRGCTIALLYEAYEQLKRAEPFVGGRGLVAPDGSAFDVDFLCSLMALLRARAQEITHVSQADLSRMRHAADMATARGSVFGMKLNECAQQLRLPRPRYVDRRLPDGRWTARVVVGDHSFTPPKARGHASLKHAQWEAARLAIRELCPERHDAAARAVDVARRRLARTADAEGARGGGDDEAAEAGKEGHLLHDSVAYLRGVLWVVAMYIDGVCPDYSYVYAHRLAPSPSQVATYLASLDPADSARQLTAPASSHAPPSLTAALVALVPRHLLSVIAPSTAALLSADTLALLEALETDEARTSEGELLSDELGKQPLLDRLTELMRRATVDEAAATGMRTQGRAAVRAGGSRAAVAGQWRTISRGDDRRQVPAHLVPRPPTRRSRAIRPYGLYLGRVRAARGARQRRMPL